MAKATKKTTKAENQNMETADSLLSITIPGIKIETASVRIIGDAPLIMHAWSVKAKQMILDKQIKKATAGKEAKDPFRDFVESMYWLTGQPELSAFSDEERALAVSGAPLNIGCFSDAQFGFPTRAFKAAAIDAGYQQMVLDKKTTARGAMHIIGEFAVIEGVPVMREDMVRIGSGVADIRFRAEFKEWSTVLNIKYNANAISFEQIVNLLNYGGFANGVGEWRPGKGGNNGTFHVDLAEIPAG